MPSGSELSSPPLDRTPEGNPKSSPLPWEESLREKLVDLAAQRAKHSEATSRRWQRSADLAAGSAMPWQECWQFVPVCKDGGSPEWLPSYLLRLSEDTQCTSKLDPDPHSGS